MRARIGPRVMVVVAAGVLAGCGGTSNSGGSSSIALTDEKLEIVVGNLCAVQGNATNVGNLTVNVTISYAAQNAAGTVIGTSTASFRVAPFSNFTYGHTQLNSQTQPSSGTFTNDLSCFGISTFKRLLLDVST